MWEKFYSKNGLAAKKIAKLLIELEEGKKIPRVSDYSNALSMGRGTVQNALSLLVELKAIQLEARGHLGTFLRWKDVNVLLEIAGIAPLTGSMPLPYSRKYEGLATGIVESFETSGKRVNLIYIRGGMNRIEALRTKRCDFSVVSKMTANKLLAEYPNLKIFATLGANSYVSSHQIFLADANESGVRAGMKIGLDSESVDQMKLAETEFMGRDIQYVDVNYMQLFEKMHAREIDATIWNRDENKMKQTFKAIDFQRPEAIEMSKDTSEATIIINKDREEEISEKWSSISKKSILQVQQNVEKGEKIPSY